MVPKVKGDKGRRHSSINDLQLMSCSIPVRNDYKGLLSISELIKGFLDRSRWVEPLAENTSQGGQHICYSFPNKLFQGRRDMWHEFPG
jgi:hypothetical protein